MPCDESSGVRLGSAYNKLRGSTSTVSRTPDGDRCNNPARTRNQARRRARSAPRITSW